MTKTTTTVLIAALAALLTAVPLTADELRLLEPSARDLVPTSISGAVAAVDAADLEMEPLRFSWPLDPAADLERPRPHSAISHEYRLVVTAAELAAGFELATHGPAAVVRINPVRTETATPGVEIGPETLVLTTPDGLVHRDGSAMETMVSAAELKSAGAPFAPGTTAFRLRADLGSGRFTVAAPDLPVDATTYLVHVLDKASQLGLTLSASSVSFLAGQPLTATAAVAGAVQKSTVTAIQGSVVSPSGARMAVMYHRAPDGTYRAELALPAEVDPGPGLWEVSASLRGEADGVPLRRDVRTAFAVAVPTARLTGEVEGRHDQDGILLEIGVEVAAASRYEVRGVLYGTDESGQRRPAALSQSAAWLGAGHAGLALEFAADLLAGSGLGAPWEVRDLELIDQARLSVLHVQARALELH